MKQAAFFDIDGTLYREGFIIDLFKMLIKCEVIDYEEWLNKVKPAFDSWEKRLGNYDSYLLTIADSYTKALKGYHRSMLDHIVKRIVQDKAMKTYVYTRNMISWHKSQGHLVFTISGSPEELVEKMAEFYELDGFRGSKYLTDSEDRYTGEVIPMWDGRSKGKAIEEIANQYNLDLMDCWSYGDTAGDLAMFKRTGHPVLINPTRELLTLARQDQDLMDRSEIVVERKDVIYRILFRDLEIIK